MLELSKASWPAGQQPTVSGADLRVEAGRLIAMVNLGRIEAAGLLRVLQGEATPAAGTILFSGKPLRELKRIKGAIARIGPEGARSSGRTVQRTVEAIARSGNSHGLLARVGLADIGPAQVRQARHADRVRLAIACALAQAPRLVLLDAPASQMTGAERTQFLLDLHDMLSGQASVVVLIGAADEALALGGDVAVFHGGELAQAGLVAEVFARPRNLAVACATAAPALNLLPMVMENGVGRLADGARFTPPPGLALPDAGACTLAFRPDDLQRERHGVDAVRFVARMNGADASGTDPSYASVTFGGAHWLAPSIPSGGSSRVLSAFVDRSRLMLFDADGRAIPTQV